MGKKGKEGEKKKKDLSSPAAPVFHSVRAPTRRGGRGGGGKLTGGGGGGGRKKRKSRTNAPFPLCVLCRGSIGNKTENEEGKGGSRAPPFPLLSSTLDRGGEGTTRESPGMGKKKRGPG